MRQIQLTRFDWLGVAAFLVALVAISWRCYQFARPADRPNDPVRTAMADFQDVVYWPTRAALAGVNPYDSTPKEAGGLYQARFPAGNNFPLYAPAIFFLSLPVAILPLPVAEFIYWLFNLGLLLLLAG